MSNKNNINLQKKYRKEEECIMLYGETINIRISHLVGSFRRRFDLKYIYYFC